MSTKNISMMGNLGTFVDDNSVISFQMGSQIKTDQWGHDRTPDKHNTFPTIRFLNVEGLNVCARGADNKGCERMEQDIKSNRLFPRLISKQINFLYGKGLFPYVENMVDNKLQRVWQPQPQITDWLDNWKENGLEQSSKDTALAIMKRFYMHRDFFVRHRITKGHAIGGYPIAGFECLENSHTRLATRNKDVLTSMVEYSDYKYVLFGNWNRGNSNFKVYPLFNERNVDDYQFAMVSHHKEDSVGEVYGLNETYEGVKRFMKTSNDLPAYIDSFLRNSLAAKVHVIIPYVWIESKRKQIKRLCDENKRREKDGLGLREFNGVEIGTAFEESLIIKHMNLELKKISEFLSGPENQGKIYATTSFKAGQNSDSESWEIKSLDLKYKEYIESLIKVDERIDEVLLSSVGMDSSITAVSKPGTISKSGSDTYYNLLNYLMFLTADDEKCAEPFNMAVKLNFPDLYKQGFRIGFYRETPSRQEEVTPSNRLENQQS